MIHNTGLGKVYGQLQIFSVERGRTPQNHGRMEERTAGYFMMCTDSSESPPIVQKKSFPLQVNQTEDQLFL